MGCAYNEAQVRVTLLKKWIRRAQSQLGWTQVLQTLLSAPFLMIEPPPPPDALRPCSMKFVFCFFGERRKRALKSNKIKLWHGDFWALVRCHLPSIGPGEATFLG